MHIDRLLLTQRPLLACALALSSVFASACDVKAPSSKSENGAISDDDDDDGSGDDGRGDDGSGDDDNLADDDATQPPKVGRDAEVKKPVDSGANRADASANRDSGVAPTADAEVADPGPGRMTGEAPTEASASKAGPYQVKTYTSGYPDAPGYADSTIHYPEGATPPFAAVAIVPGFVSPQSSIQMWGPFFASHGIVAMTIGTNTPTDLPPMREQALWEAIGTIKGEHTREDSPLKGKLDLQRLATMGWSMGGGGTLLAAENHAELKAVIALCPWNPGYSYGKVTVPTLLLATQADVLAGGQSQPFYDSIPAEVPKLLWERAGADHWANNNPAQEGGAVGRYGLSWLKVYLEGDKRYESLLKQMPPNASDHKSNLK